MGKTRVDYRDTQYAKDQAAAAEEEDRRIRAENAAAGVPTQTNLGTTREKHWYGDTVTPTDAYYLDPTTAGTMTELEKAQFYDEMRRAETRGSDIYGQQQDLIRALQDRAAGRGGPSLAEMQLGQTLEQNKRDAAGALAAAGRGINPALAQRILLQQRANLQQQAAGQSAILRAKEQQDAQTLLGSTLSGVANTSANIYGNAGQLGLSQAKEVADLAEAQKKRDLELAKANQEAAQKAAGQSATLTMNAADNTAEQVKTVAEAPVELAKALKAQGGWVQRYASGGRVCAAGGGKINAAMGALSKMDNEANDTVPAMLSPGEIVLPRSVVSAPNAPVAAAKFVEALLANKNKKDAKMIALKTALSKK